MNRIILPLLSVGVIVVLIGIAGFWTVASLINPALSLARMQELEEKPAEAVKEMPGLLAALDQNNKDIKLQAALTLGRVGSAAVAVMGAIPAVEAAAGHISAGHFVLDPSRDQFRFPFDLIEIVKGRARENVRRHVADLARE